MADLSSEHLLGSSAQVDGRYSIHWVLGRGGSATVYEAHDQFLDQRVALKLLHSTPSSSLDADRLRQEIRIARSIRHLNVVRIEDSGAWLGRPYYTMELIEGAPLQYSIPTGEAAALGFVASAARGLGAVHRAGVLHRDIKPANLQVTPRGRVIVMDFGSARCDELDLVKTAAHKVVGTLRYMSPERLKGRRFECAGSDLWSLGIVLLELLTGVPVFEGDTPLEIMSSIQVAQVRHLESRLSGLTDPTKDLVRALLQRDPEARPSADRAAELASAAGGAIELQGCHAIGG